MGSAEYVEPVVNYIENYEHSLRMEAASKQAIHFRSIWNVSKCLFVNASKCLFFTHIHSSRLIPISSCFFFFLFKQAENSSSCSIGHR